MNLVRRLLLCVCLLGAAGASLAEPAPEMEPQDEDAATVTDEAAAGAIFSPFAAAIGTAKKQPAAQPPAAEGSLTLPLAAALAGTLGIGLLVGKFLD